MSLFHQLSTHRWGTEDYFTEIVAYLLRETDGLLFEWLDYLGLADTEEYFDYDISTQAAYDEGRPDILIELYTEEAEDVIFIESKLGTHEGHQQLRRYARALAKLSHVRSRHLLYITRNFDPKDKQSILKNLPANSVAFRQLRWSDFYRFIESKRDDRLIDETCAFMEKMRMSQSNQFSPSDILAMSRLPQVFSLMNETLFGEVSTHFKEVVGEVSSKRAITRQLPLDRYVLNGDLLEDKSIFLGLGYWFKEADYPYIGLFMALYPNATNKDPILRMLRELNQEAKWQGYRLNKPRNWPELVLERPLNEFVAGEDHVSLIKQCFLEQLDEIVSIKNRYPHLAWRVSGDGSGDLDEEE